MFEGRLEARFERSRSGERQVSQSFSWKMSFLTCLVFKNFRIRSTVNMKALQDYIKKDINYRCVSVHV
jgi:hypothetical protein